MRKTEIGAFSRYQCLIATGPHNHKLQGRETTYKEILLETTDSLTTGSEVRNKIP